jgi:Flagellar protein FlaF
MRPEQQIQQAPRPVSHAGVMTGEATQLDDIATRLMTVQRHWNHPDRVLHLAAALESSRAAWHSIQAALAEGMLSLPADVQHNLLILSVYADYKIGLCESAPSADGLGGLIALTHTLAGSLRQWREAA